MNTYWTEAAQLYLILHQSCFSLKSDHQDLLRSFTFTVPQRRNDLHLTSSEEPLLFISQSALHYMFGSFQSHLTETYYWRYRLIFRSFYVSICSTVINISLIYITSIRISSYKYQHLQQIHIFELFFLHILTIWAIKARRSNWDTQKKKKANFLNICLKVQ